MKLRLGSTYIYKGLREEKVQALVNMLTSMLDYYKILCGADLVNSPKIMAGSPECEITDVSDTS